MRFLLGVGTFIFAILAMVFLVQCTAHLFN